jgi:hypothetical protein
VAEVLERFYNATDAKGKMANAKLFYRGPQKNLGQKTLADVEVNYLRGKLVLLCDNPALASSHFKPGDGYCLYDRYPSTSGQIRFCGKYTGDLKTATRALKKDRGNWSPEGAAKNAEDGCNEHKKHPSDHLLWVYWQETGGNVWANTRATGGMSDRLDNFLSRIKDPKNNLSLPNVIGHDFVSRFKCGAIAKMNKPVDTELDIGGY